LGLKYVPDFDKVMVEMVADMIEVGFLKNEAK